MQYGHMALPDRRDTNLDSNGSTPFQTHQGLSQALGHNHLGPPPSAYARGPQDAYRHPSTSPPTLNQAGGPPQGHAGAHQGITFAVTNNASPALKRKQMDNSMSSVLKRRRDAEDPDGYDMDGAGQGAKHWTDDEKTKLFRWLMGPNSDEHWSALRATKNSCLRECATEVFEGKKTYQALKGCYERNFNLFKQIHALEAHHNHPGPYQGPEPDRLREYDRRLQIARKANVDIGNITSRTIEHWYNRGWYELFFSRWHGDPATTKPLQGRNSTNGPNAGVSGADDHDEDDNPTAMDFTPDPTILVNGLNGMPHDRPPQPHQVHYINPQSLSRAEVPSLPPHVTATGGPVQATLSSSSSVPPAASGISPTPNHNHVHMNNNVNNPTNPSSSAMPSQNSSVDPTGSVTITLTPPMVNAFMQFLQVQTQATKVKMEYLRRREDREDKEHRLKQELDKITIEKTRQDLEASASKQKVERALDLLKNESDPSVKTAAAEYLRKYFLDES